MPPIEDFDITLLGADDSFGADIVARKVIESEAILVASPDYLKRRGAPAQPQDLATHECLRLRQSNDRTRVFLDFLLQETRQPASQALEACSSCHS